MEYRSSYNHMMFHGFSNSVFNQNIAAWDTRKVNDMSYMFTYATSFNQNISGWNTNKVAKMSYMFSSATSFKHNLCRWVKDNPKFPKRINTNDMFSNSGCPNTSNPSNS